MSGMLKSMKYTINSRGQLLYRRRYPMNLQGHPQVTREFYTKSLGVKENDSDSVKLSAWQRVHEDYERWIKGLQLANAEALEATELLRLAEATLRANGLEPGMLAPNPLLSDAQNEAVGDENYYRVLESGVMDASIARENAGQAAEGTPLTAQERISDTAWKLLKEPKERAISKAVLLSECWEPYREHQGIDVTTRDGKRALKRWERLLEYTGDRVLDQAGVHEALDEFVDRRQKEVKGSSVKRELGAALAVIRHTVKAKRLPIVISPPLIKAANDHKQRRVLTDVEAQSLLMHIRSSNVKDQYEGAYYLMFHGLIASEIARLRPENLKLDEPIPHVAIEGDTKTESRKRYVPIVLGIERLREIQATVGTLSRALGDSMDRTESNLSHSLGKIMKRGTSNRDLTPYSLRHTLKANLLANEVDSQVIALIGGWSGLVNPVMLGYGSAAYSEGKTMRRLSEALIRTFEATGLIN